MPLLDFPQRILPVGKSCGLLAALTMLLALPSLAGAREYHCVPEIKYECDKIQCKRITENFQHAESFTYNDKNAVFSACLWTNCYAGKAKVFRNKSAGTTLAIAKLKPLNGVSGYMPIIASLTYDAAGNFNATWQYGSQSTTFDLGKCQIKRKN
ncbi:MAG: hypothetical protein H6R18_1161 [Proteobacteria bacterium]|nr:hypothetical protein [Pseudomonadota bacterium]